MKNIVQHNDNIWVIESLLSEQQCDVLLEFSESEGYEEATITTRKGPVMDKQIRDNSRLIYDDQDMCDELWEIIQPYVKQEQDEYGVCGLNERLRFYKYESSQRFNWHYDGCFIRDNKDKSFFTLMFYLNDSFTGGTTNFIDVEITPKKGDALIFWHHQLHTGKPVISGTKYVLRTDIMYREKRVGKS